MEGIELNLDSIYEGSDVDFFQDEEITEEPKTGDSEITDENVTEESDDSQLFEDDEVSEVVGDNKDTKENNPTSDDVDTSSPNTYSSIASAFKEDGVVLFSDAEDSELTSINDAESFREFLEERINKEVESRLNDTQKRINEALGYGTNPKDIELFESSLAQLNSIHEEDITDESEQGETLRKQLIYTDYINKGFTKERALKKTQQSFDAGTDIDDAKEALESNKDFYQSKYNEVLKTIKEEANKRREKSREQAEALKKSILDDKDGFGGMEVSETVRRKVYETINKPVAKNDAGAGITALQKFAAEHPNEFMKYVGYFYVTTDGFTKMGNIEKTVETKVKKQQMSAFERAINSTARNSNGSLKFIGAKNDSAGIGWELDL